jgi:acyl-CoA synthetase (AMP-forming)/AMP-acid ligase II
MQPVATDLNLIQRVNVADIVRRSAAQYGERIAIISAIENVTFAELHNNVNQYARALLGHGVKRGDFVGLLFRSSIDFFRAYFACARVGATAVPLNPNLKSSDYEYIVEETRIRLLIVHGDLLPVAVDMQRAAPAIDLVVSSNCSGGSTPEDLLGAMKWSEFVGLGTSSGVYLNDVEVMVDDRDSAQCIYTSGTTAAPKGVLTSHLAATFSAVAVAHHGRLTATDTTLVCLPNHHVAGLNNSVIPYLMVGATTVLLDGWDAQTVAEALERYRVTVMIITGPMMIELFERFGGRYDWTSVRLFVLGISSLPADRAALVRELCPRADLLMASGQTEFTGYQEGMRPEDQDAKAGAWGNATMMTDVAIMDSGAILPPQEVGEIVYRGPTAMTGYLGHRGETEQATAHGWFHSGDLGFLDDAGTVHFVDRIKDMIKTGGENVASMEVAQAIMLHPCVAECAVVGIPHPRWSEAITAFVKTQANEVTEAELLAHCRDKLAPFKVPKRILFVDEFPRTASRKIRNVDLREQYRMIYQ